MAGKKTTALITGYDGFVGPWLAEELLSHGRRVTGTYFAENKPPVAGKISLLPLDLAKYGSVREVISKSMPDEVYHLAGISHVPTSWANPRKTFVTNLMGTVHLFEALREEKGGGRILAVSSAEVYGIPEPRDLPTKETAPLKPENPYAASKAALDLLAYQWSRHEDFHIVRVRPFSHTGPGQSPGFACPGFARQIAGIARGLHPPVMTVGDLSAKRDFTDVRDVVRAYRLVLEKGECGEVFNVSSGRSRSIRGILRTLRGFCKKRIRVETDPELLRPVRIPETRGSHSKLSRATGWGPEIPFDRTLKDLYEYWLRQA